MTGPKTLPPVEDPLAPARGCLNALLIMMAVYTLCAAVVLVILELT